MVSNGKRYCRHQLAFVVCSHLLRIPVKQWVLLGKTRVIGYSLFPVGQLLHGAHVRPYYICKEMQIPLLYQKRRHILPGSSIGPLVAADTLIVFPGYTTDPADLLLISLAKKRGCRIALDVADIPYLQYYYFNGQPSKRAITDFNFLVSLSDTLFFSTSSILREARRLMSLENKRCAIIRNASDPMHFRFTDLPENKVIFYVGGYIPSRGLDELIKAYRILRARKISCRLNIVSINFPEHFQEDGVQIWRRLYYNQIPPLFESSNVFVIPHRPNLYMQIATPLKLFDAMASGRPVVSTRCEETVRILEEERCGMTCDDEPESIADAIEHIFENPDEAQKMGARGRAAVETKYSWTASARDARELLLGS